ncbi:MAG: hypothetical protein IPM77_03390 [Crocinitomicaceae bacterium]|nr:hypothetical protein [Crocinitomicaceae bacterium]
MMSLLLASLFAVSAQYQPSKLQLIEEALDRVLLTHSINYEKGNKLEGRLADVTITYTGNTVIDAKQDSLYYFVYGTYTYAKYSYIQAPNPISGGTTGKSYSSNGSRSYVARVKSVLDDYRVQDIVVVDDPEKFDFQNSIYDSLKVYSDWVYPTAVYQSSGSKKKEDK